MNESRKQFVEFAKNNEFIVTIQNGEFLYPATREAWKIWQESRAAIEIELPENKWHPCDCIDVVIAFDKDDVIESIRAAGIKVKE